MTKTYIIAEFAQSFEGDISLCKKLVQLAKKCGAQAVKFQIFAAKELCTENYQYYDLFKSLEMDKNAWQEVFSYAKSLELDFIADIFGEKSLEELRSIGLNSFKIHSTDIKNHSLLQALKDANLTIYLATGGSSLKEVEQAIAKLGQNKIVLLSGFQAEPNQLSDVELDKIEFLQKHFSLPVGYADHLDANDSLAVDVPAMAVLKGATVIEKHLTIERNFLQLEDFLSALNPDEFLTMVEKIKKVEAFSYTGMDFSLSKREEEYRIRAKKVVLAQRRIEKGQKISPEDLVLLRTGEKVETTIMDIEKVIGKLAKQNIQELTAITTEMLQ